MTSVVNVRVKRAVTAGSAEHAAVAAKKKGGLDNMLAAIDGPKTISTVSNLVAAEGMFGEAERYVVRRNLSFVLRVEVQSVMSLLRVVDVSVQTQCNRCWSLRERCNRCVFRNVFLRAQLMVLSLQDHNSLCVCSSKPFSYLDPRVRRQSTWI